MRERSDGRWSLPGGWADPLDPPSLAAEREIREETGYVARAVKLVGCWDRDLQGHTPPLPVHAYKLFFLCEQEGPVGPPDDLETLESAGSLWTTCRNSPRVGSPHGNWSG